MTNQISNGTNKEVGDMGNGMAGSSGGELSDEEFAARMRGARAMLKLNLKEAGELFGHSQQGMSRRESGTVEIPPAERYHFAGIYLELTGLPRGWFSQGRGEIGNES